MSDSSRRKNKPRSREERARAKRARVWRRVALIAGGAAALVAVTLAVVLPLRAAGVFLRARTVAEIPGARVDGAMYSYYFYSSFYDELAGENAALYERNGIDENTDLRGATYGEGMSWFDFFEGVSRERLASILQYAARARDAGHALSSQGSAELESRVATLSERATAAGRSLPRYLAERFGVGVKEKDVRAMLSLLLLAGEEAERAKADVAVSDEEAERLLAEDEEFALSVSNVSFFYYIIHSENLTDRALAQARDDAERLMAIDDPQMFVNEVYRIESALAREEGEEMTSELFAQIEEDFRYLRFPVTRALDIDPQIAARRAGEKVLFDEAATGSFGVLYVLEPVSPDETPTVSYRAALFPDEDSARTLEQRIARGSGALSGEEFLRESAAAGGVSGEGGDERALASIEAEDPALAAWLSEADPGEIHREGSTVYYFEREGAPAAFAAARSHLLREKYDEIDAQTAQDYAAVTVRENSASAVARRRGE